MLPHIHKKVTFWADTSDNVTSGIWVWCVTDQCSLNLLISVRTRYEFSHLRTTKCSSNTQKSSATNIVKRILFKSLESMFPTKWTAQFLEKNKFAILSYLIHNIEHSLHWEAKNDEAAQAFYKTPSVLSCSQEPTTHPFPRSGECGQYLLTQFLAELF